MEPDLRPTFVKLVETLSSYLLVMAEYTAFTQEAEAEKEAGKWEES
jgi:hypothetical protein